MGRACHLGPGLGLRQQVWGPSTLQTRMLPAHTPATDAFSLLGSQQPVPASERGQARAAPAEQRAESAKGSEQSYWESALEQKYPPTPRKNVCRDRLSTYCTGGREGERDLAKTKGKAWPWPTLPAALVHWNEGQAPEHSQLCTSRSGSGASDGRAGILPAGCY